MGLWRMGSEERVLNGSDRQSASFLVISEMIYLFVELSFDVHAFVTLTVKHFQPLRNFFSVQ